MRGLLGSLYLSWAIWSVIFCLPVIGEDQHRSRLSQGDLRVPTVTAGLYRSFDVANTLDGDAVLVITVDELILELTDFVNQDTKLIGDI